MSYRLNIAKCRETRSYTSSEYIGRMLWALVSPLFFWSPRPLFGWRRFLLRMFGARVGSDVHIYPSAKIYIPWNLKIEREASIGEWALIYNLGMVEIGEQATISHRAHLCAGSHDHSHPNLPLIRAPISIGARAWICSDAFVGPGVTVHEGAIAGGASVVVKDVGSWQIVAGNPAKMIGERNMCEPIDTLVTEEVVNDGKN